MRRWSITIRWDRPEHSPWRTTRYEILVDTPAQLRRLVEAARKDPHVTAFPYHSVRDLVGDWPRRCPAGHEYPGRVAGRLIQDGAPCGCGGHHVFICVEPGCRYRRVADRPESSWRPSRRCRYGVEHVVGRMRPGGGRARVLA